MRSTIDKDTLPKVSPALSIKENTFIVCFSAPQGSWFGLTLRLIDHKKASRWGRKARMGLRSALAYLSQLLFRALCLFLFPFRFALFHFLFSFFFLSSIFIIRVVVFDLKCGGLHLTNFWFAFRA